MFCTGRNKKELKDVDENILPPKKPVEIRKN
jgi:hypothetical protein